MLDGSNATSSQTMARVRQDGWRRLPLVCALLCALLLLIVCVGYVSPSSIWRSMVDACTTHGGDYESCSEFADQRVDEIIPAAVVRRRST